MATTLLPYTTPTFIPSLIPTALLIDSPRRFSVKYTESNYICIKTLVLYFFTTTDWNNNRFLEQKQVTSTLETQKLHVLHKKYSLSILRVQSAIYHCIDIVMSPEKEPGKKKKRLREFDASLYEQCKSVCVCVALTFSDCL